MQQISGGSSSFIPQEPVSDQLSSEAFRFGTSDGGNSNTARQALTFKHSPWKYTIDKCKSHGNIKLQEGRGKDLFISDYKIR
jgi:hypothetical protein